MKRFLVFLAILLLSGFLYADQTAASLSKSDIQTAIDAASEGETVNLPSGTNDTIDASTPITITTNNLHIKGAGIAATIISTDNGTYSTVEGIFRATSVTGFKFSDMKLDGQNVQDQAEVLLALNFCTDIEVFNCNFTNSSLACVRVKGYPIQCVIHDCNFSDGYKPGYGYGVAVRGEKSGEAVGDYGDQSFTDALGLGSTNCVVVEDCTFDTFRHYIMTMNGARATIRYNTVTADAGSGSDVFDTHGNSEPFIGRGVRQYEIYENAVDFPATENPYFQRRDSGDGVIYNNTITNYGGAQWLYAVVNCGASSPAYTEPGSTITVGDWTASAGDLDDCTDDDNATPDNDTTYIYATATDTDYCELKFTTPDKYLGKMRHLIRIWARVVDGEGDETIDFHFYRGATLVESFTGQTITGSYVKYEEAIAQANIDTNITTEAHYTDLRVRIDINGNWDGDDVCRVTMAELLIDCGDYPWRDQWQSVYVWGNTVNGGADNTFVIAANDTDEPGHPYWVVDRDWYESEMGGYTALAYPHPLRVPGGITGGAIKIGQEENGGNGHSQPEIKKPQKAPINPEYKKWVAEIVLEFATGVSRRVRDEKTRGLRPEKNYLPHVIEDNARRTANYVSPTDYPVFVVEPYGHGPMWNSIMGTGFFDAYDSRDVSKTTAARDQGGCAVCWVFAFMGTLEGFVINPSNHNLTWDLAEESMKECNVHQRGASSCGQGTWTMAAAYGTDPGIPYEADEAYVASANQGCDTSDAWRAIVTEWVILSGSSVAALETELETYGPFYTNMDSTFSYGGGTFANAYDDACVNGPGSPVSDHAVCVVGYDDAISAPCDAGLWVVKNSWGTTWGDDGFFYIEQTPDNSLVGVTVYAIRDVKLFDPEQVIYNYAEGGWDGQYGYVGVSEAYGLVKFTADRDIMIYAIQTYSPANTLTYAVHIYDSFDGSTLGNQLYGVTGETFANTGFFTYTLTTPLEFKKGDDIVIRVKYDYAAYATPVPCDDTDTAYCDIETAKTYMSENGTSNWTDMGDVNSEDVAIRALGRFVGKVKLQLGESP